MNGHSNIDPMEATEHLKNILNVGKSETDDNKLHNVSNGDIEVPTNVESVVSAAVSSEDLSYQRIDLNTGKESAHISIHGKEVDVFSSPLEFGASCNEVFVDNMVDYGWEEKLYAGKLIAIHLSGKFLAYVLKPANKTAGFVRILQTKTNARLLIKDYRLEVKDLSFAHSMSPVLLASVDCCGELAIHKITEEGDKLLCTQIMRCLRPSNWLPSEYNRVIWLMYIPEDATEDEVSEEDASTLVVTHDGKAEIWNIDIVIKSNTYDALTIDDVKYGAQAIPEHSSPIVAASFSPDGTALAIASLDGVVKFFQVGSLEKNAVPKCLHQWTPHPGKDISTLHFLDNHRAFKPDDQFWKLAVTGADNNTEIKIWGCEKWVLLQTLRFHPNPADNTIPSFKSEIDLSSKYLFLSDINRKVLLIVLFQDMSLTDPIACTLSEYRVPHPVLSMAIVKFSPANPHALAQCKSSEDDDRDNMDDLIPEEDNADSYIAKLFWIQSKSLQSCRIIYRPKVLNHSWSKSLQTSCLSPFDNSEQDNHVHSTEPLTPHDFKDGLSDISLDTSHKDLDISMSKSLIEDIINQKSPLFTNKSTEILLTPDDFTSPSNSFAHGDGSAKVNLFPSPGGGILPKDETDSLPVGTLQLRRKSSQHSGASSPSREVAEILGPTHLVPLGDKIQNAASLLPSLNNIFDAARKNTESSWPQAPDPLKTFESTIKSENQIICNSLHSLADLIMELKGDFQNLCGEVKQLRHEQKIMSVQSSHLEAAFLKKIEEDHQVIEKNFAAKLTEISTTLNSNLQNSLKQEAATNVLPQINEMLDSMSQKLLLEVNKKLTTTDASLRECLTKQLKGKAFMESLSQSMSSSIQNIIHLACSDIMLNSILPAFDNTCSNTFRQLHDAFKSGITKFLRNIEKEGQKLGLNLDSHNQKLKEEITAVMSGVHSQFVEEIRKIESVKNNEKEKEELLLSDMRNVVQEEMRKGFSDQVSVLSSRCVTPATSHSDLQMKKEEITNMVRKGNLPEAFQEALSALDVPLVVFLCEMVSVDELFPDGNCILHQNVLLAMVNQLSSDLDVKTELKVKYLQEVIISLDSENPLFRDHIRNSMHNLLIKINTFQKKNPGQVLSRQFRKLILSVNSLTK